MEWNELPVSFRSRWENMSRKEQRQVVTMLVEHVKPLTYRLKMEATVEKVGRTLMYLQKYSIPHTVERKGKYVIFTFEGMSARNQVLLGRCTL